MKATVLSEIIIEHTALSVDYLANYPTQRVHGSYANSEQWTSSPWPTREMGGFSPRKPANRPYWSSSHLRARYYSQRDGDDQGRRRQSL
jgi:hypothetical protein